MGERRDVHLEVKGMTCQGCVNAVTRVVQRKDPSAQVKIDLAAGRLDGAARSSPRRSRRRFPPPATRPASSDPLAGSIAEPGAAILPSTICTRRSALAASSRSCVTMTMALPCCERDESTSLRRIASTCSLDAVSRLPVGSSARISGGSLASARAMATRWRWPPESWSGRLCAWSARPSEASSVVRARAHGLLAERAQRAHRQHDVVERRELRQQEVELEHEAQLDEPQRARARPRPMCVVARPSMQHLARGRQVEQPEQVEQRGLARARRPGDGDELAGCDGEVDVAHQRGRHHRRRCAVTPRRDQRRLDAARRRDACRAAHVAPRMISTGCTRAALRAGK